MNELEKRHKAYKTAAEKFNFLFHLQDLEVEEVETAKRNLGKHYKDEIEESFGMECIHFEAFSNCEIDLVK